MRRRGANYSYRAPACSRACRYARLTNRGDLRPRVLLQFHHRYQPHRFERLADRPFGPFVDEFIFVQPEQMLYLLASEIADVRRPPGNRLSTRRFGLASVEAPRP